MSSPRPHPPDRIRISDLQLHLPHGLGPSAFGLVPAPPCPALLSLEIELDDSVVPSCTTDDTMGGLGINYSSTSKALIALCEGRAWSAPEELVRAASSVPLQLDVVRSVRVRLELPKALLPARAAVYSALFARGQMSRLDTDGRGGSDGSGGASRAEAEWECEVKDLRVRTIIGLHPHERQMRQWLEVDVGVQGYAAGWDHRLFAEGVYDWLDKSEYRTIEALIDALARYILTDPLFGEMLTERSDLSITLRKPSALAFACPVISVQRSRADYTSSAAGVPAQAPAVSIVAATTDASGNSTTPARVFIAIGSNIGDRIGHLRRAVDHVATQPGIKLVSTSRLYESEPMYVEDQDRFINGVIELQSSLAPLEILRVLKRTERLIGRTKTFRNGPRVVDLDLLAYGGERVQIGRVDDPEDEDGIGWLECPHPRIGEREFVLRPWADLAPRFFLPGTASPISDLLTTLLKDTAPSLAPIIPFPRPALPLRLEGSPRLMQIFNATPDSFSDGHSDNLDVTLALQSITALFDRFPSSGLPPSPDILDIGGMSTRPNSTPCTEQEELDRVVPLIRAIRSSSDERLKSVPISIDTYRASVAHAAVEAGASCINDVRGGWESGMKETMAELGVPVVIMHSRGDSTSMGTAAAQDYSALGGVVAGVRVELGERVRAALDAGVKRWDVVLDPGLGFAKTPEDNLALLRRVTELNAACATASSEAGERSSASQTSAQGTVGAEHVLAGLPILVGGSRKGFVGRAIGRGGKDEASQRGYGDAAVVSWCAARSGSSLDASGASGPSGVDVLRVHDSRAMGEVLSMWRAIAEA